MGANGMPPGLACVDLGMSQSISLINDTPLVNSIVGRLHYGFVSGVTDVEWDCINTRCVSLSYSLLLRRWAFDSASALRQMFAC